MRFWCGVAALAAVALGGCVKPPVPVVAKPALQAVRFDQLPGWPGDALIQTYPALQAECHRMALLPVDTKLGGQGLAASFGGKAGQWTGPCVALGQVIPNDAAGLRRFYEAWFQPYRLTDPGIFTGYYEPEVQGALTQGGGFDVPLLGRPKDLLQSPPPADDPGAPPLVGRLVKGKLVAYPARAEIEAGAIGSAARALFWLRDPADLFFLQIQGAGRIRLPDGSVMRVTYDGKNGRPYTPIGRVLVEQNALSIGDVTMQSIRAWLTAHPGQAKSVMDRNEDYVFFRVLTDTDNGKGPPGALGVNLTKERSAAVDPHFVPLGAPVFIDTTDPISGAAWRVLMLAQDTGTDIKGAGRTDIFFGSGALAEQKAGWMRQGGTEYLLLPRPVG